jgi:hypothetical protein
MMMMMIMIIYFFIYLFQLNNRFVLSETINFENFYILLVYIHSYLDSEN